MPARADWPNTEIPRAIRHGISGCKRIATPKRTYSRKPILANACECHGNVNNRRTGRTKPRGLQSHYWRKIAITLNDQRSMSVNITIQSYARLVAMNPSNDTWSEYRKWRNISLFALVGYVPIVFGAGVLSMRLFNTFAPALCWHCVDGICGYRREHLSALSLSQMRQSVFRKVVVLQRLCAAMRPPRPSKVCGPSCELLTVAKYLLHSVARSMGCFPLISVVPVDRNATW